MALYDAAWADRYERAANAAIPGRDAIYRICDACLAELPPDSRVLVVGAGTGGELLRLATSHPTWRFTAVEPSAAMLAVCRQRLESIGCLERVHLVAGTLDDLRASGPFDAATAILVAQHFPDDDEAQRFLTTIASRLSPCGLFFSAHLSPPDEPLALDRMLQTWRRQAASAGLPDVSEVSSRLGRDLALRSSQQIRELHQQSGFEAASLYFRSLIYTAWLAQRAATGRLDEMG